VQGSDAYYSGITQHVLFPNGFQFTAVDEWAPKLTRQADKDYIEETVMALWSSITLRVGDIVVALANSSGGRSRVSTGMHGVVEGFDVEHASTAFNKFRGHDEISNMAKLSCCGATLQGVSHIVSPLVRFFSPGGHAGGFQVTVLARKRMAYSKQGDLLVTRVQVRHRAPSPPTSTCCACSACFFLRVCEHVRPAHGGIRKVTERNRNPK
jgi:hypothetical protein